MAEISWIKLKTTMFDDEKIRLIQSVPESDAILVIWIRLLVLAGKTNDDGLIYIQRNMPYSEEMLATLFGKNVNTVRLALTTLANFNMIDLTTDGLIAVTNWEKHQNVEGLEKIREQNRLRAKRHYDKQKNSNVSLTLSNATDIDKELDIDIDKERDIVEQKIPFSEIIDYLNLKAGKKFKTTDKHKTLIRARWNEGQKLEDFKQVIDNKVHDAENPRDLFDAKYLQPSTLFGAKFDQYLNQVPKTEEKEVIYDDGLNF
ncbi:phage replisome organizer N-terminal domain-containing protein [Carnobacterium maltaromaticum]|uniref:phage replisome organizer N-terminal domain-containing protein n=1 Tax=Carnobacterium maltaromaticum TaxID=2751 RepID=UPI0012FB62FD|nr:phage replisome organizer N-terminal domain-containing protein [Carnobacterium maltaromaticum]